MNLEVYPVGLARYDAQGNPKTNPNAGLDAAWYPGSATSVQLTVNPDFAEIEADPTIVNLGRYETWLPEHRPFFTEGAGVFNLGPYGTDIFYSRRIGKPLEDGGAAPIAAGLKGITQFDRWEVGALDAAVLETTLVGTDTALVSNYSVLRVRRSILRNSSLGILYAGKENRLMNNRAAGVDAAWRQGDFDADGDIAYAQYQRDALLLRSPAGRFAFGWQGDVFNAGMVYVNVPHKFDVQDIGYEPVKHEYYTVNAGALFRNLGVLRDIGPGASVTRSHDNDDLVHHYYTTNGNVSLNLDFKNNWGAGASGSLGDVNAYVYDPPRLDSTFHYLNAGWSAWFWTDQSFPFNIYFYGTGTGRGYDYLRHYFAPNAYGDLTMNWRLAPSFTLSADVQNTVEFDTLDRIGEMDWIITPTINYALTKDLQVMLSSEVVPGDSEMRLSFLFSWNLRPKTWLYLAWIERHELTPGLPLLEHVGVLKLRYLFYF